MASVPEIQIEATALQCYKAETFNDEISRLINAGWSVAGTACKCSAEYESDEIYFSGASTFCAILTRVVDNGNTSE